MRDLRDSAGGEEVAEELVTAGLRQLRLEDELSVGLLPRMEVRVELEVAADEEQVKRHAVERREVPDGPSRCRFGDREPQLDLLPRADRRGPRFEPEHRGRVEPRGNRNERHPAARAPARPLQPHVRMHGARVDDRARRLRGPPGRRDGRVRGCADAPGSRTTARRRRRASRLLVRVSGVSRFMAPSRRFDAGTGARLESRTARGATDSPAFLKSSRAPRRRTASLSRARPKVSLPTRRAPALRATSGISSPGRAEEGPGRRRGA